MIQWLLQKFLIFIVKFTWDPCHLLLECKGNTRVSIVTRIFESFQYIYWGLCIDHIQLLFLNEQLLFDSLADRIRFVKQIDIYLVAFRCHDKAVLFDDYAIAERSFFKVYSEVIWVVLSNAAFIIFWQIIQIILIVDFKWILKEL